YGVYETGAIKRLMGRHATREAEVDRLLRAGRFVDLHAVVKQSLRASVEEYSIKRLEPLYGFERKQALDEAGAALRVVERAVELGARLLAGVPELPEERSEKQQAVWLLAHMLDFHRREEKAPWWEYYRLRELPDEELLDETAALAGLELVERRPASGRTPVDRYRFQAQETRIREGDK